MHSIVNADIVIFFQLVLALGLGMIIGIQRVLSHKTAGMRTYALVTMGSALFVILSQIIEKNYIGVTDFQPTQIAAAIITGIGFLGAGLIIFKDDKISGLTTAASLWVACGVGIAVGYQQYWIALITTFLTLFIFTLLWDIEDKIKKVMKRDDEPRME